ncbi:hypothetical protein Tco_1301341 [Tanacetum coccineum]
MLFWKRNTLISNNDGTSSRRNGKPKRKDTEVPQPSGPIDNVADEAVYEEMDDSLERAATTATSLDAEQDRGNINKTQSKATLNEPSSLGTSSGSGPRRQETMGDTIAQTGFENVSKTSNDSLLAGVNTPRSDEDSLKLKELMELCTNLQNRVIDLEKTKTSQAQEITSLKRRVKRLEKKGGSRTHGLKRLYKVGLSRRVESFDEEVWVWSWWIEVVVESKVAIKAASIILVGVAIIVSATATTIPITPKEITLAQAHEELKTAKPKVKGIIFKELVESKTTTIVSSQQSSQLNVQDKGKGKMVEPEPVKKLSKKNQLMLDEELAFKLQAKEEEEEERLAKEKSQQIKEANIVSWDNVQAMIDADYQMA